MVQGKTKRLNKLENIAIAHHFTYVNTLRLILWRITTDKKFKTNTRLDDL